MKRNRCATQYTANGKERNAMQHRQNTIANYTKEDITDLSNEQREKQMHQMTGKQVSLGRCKKEKKTKQREKQNERKRNKGEPTLPQVKRKKDEQHQPSKMRECDKRNIVTCYDCDTHILTRPSIRTYEQGNKYI